MDNRLRMCQYRGDVDSLIGESEYSNGTLERTLRLESELRKDGTKKTGGMPPSVVSEEVEKQLTEDGVVAYYHGWETLCNLCTGDVSNILELLNRMFEDCEVTRESEQRILPRHQDAVIQNFSLQYVSKIKGIAKYGERMFEIVDAFGNAAKRLLEDRPLVGKRGEPYRLIRIELDEADRGNQEWNKDGEASELWKALQRYCIFVDAVESRSIRNTLSSRVLFRRIFCPAFRIGLVNSECWRMSKKQWEAFVSDPSGRAEGFVKASIAENVSDGQKRIQWSDED